MSFINVSVTHRFDHAARPARRIDAGFSREGGRLDLLTRTITPASVDATVQSLRPTPALEAAGRGLLDAISGAGWLQDVVVEHPLTRTPGRVSWTSRFGTTGHAAADALPAPVKAVLDAASALDREIDRERRSPSAHSPR